MSIGSTRTEPATRVWPDRFTGQVLLVTGAGGGLGRAVCARLQAEGATVIAADIAFGDDVHAEERVPLDAGDRQSWAQLVEHVLDNYGRLHGLMLGHGVQGPESPTHEVSTSEWERTVGINLTGCFHGLSVVLPPLLAQGYGRIAALASIAAKEGNLNQSAYSASKAALVALVKSTAKETAQHGITVNTIAPSMFETAMLDEISDEHKARLLDRVPMGRMGRPPELAALAAWLLSEEASYTTGQCFDLSGGRATC